MPVEVVPLRLPLLFLVAVLLVGSRAVAGEAQVRRWVDEDGVVHIEARIGPTKEAVAKAAKLSVKPRATGAKAKVHETSDWDLHIFEAAEKYKIPHELVRAVIVTESNFDPSAVSHAGARGLMQLMPRTAREMYVEDMHDPVDNIHGGTRYLRILANMFDGDLVKTVAAYNAGPEAVKRAKGIPRITETQDYVRKVLRLYRIYKGLD